MNVRTEDMIKDKAKPKALPISELLTLNSN